MGEGREAEPFHGPTRGAPRPRHDGLPPEREKPLNLALNKIGGDWDQQKLAELLDGLTQVPGFDVELTGFDLPEVESLIAGQIGDPGVELY